jgi:hypothetical protein
MLQDIEGRVEFLLVEKQTGSLSEVEEGELDILLKKIRIC